jgi:RNA polymerase sigma-70 factor (ECF subfamily)
MLKTFPTVARFEETGDVLNNALVRLLRCLEKVEPKTTRDFFNLAAVEIRRELIDLARHYQREQNCYRAGADAYGDYVEALDPADSSEMGESLERWSRFHEAVEELPTKEREVFSLAFYHGWTQAEIAKLYHSDERTIRRWWHSACLHLHEALQGELPDLVT